MLGVMKEIQNRNSSEWLNVILFRSRFNEIITAIGKLMPTTRPQIMTLFQREVTRPGCRIPSVQLERPHVRVLGTNQSDPGWKLLMSNSMTRQMR